MNHIFPRPRCRVRVRLFQNATGALPSSYPPHRHPGCLTYLHPRTSSGPALIVGDNPVSGSLVSQSKCHSGGGADLFPVAQASAAGPPCAQVTPVVPTTRAKSSFVCDRPFFHPPYHPLPLSTPVIHSRVHLGFIHGGTP